MMPQCHLVAAKLLRGGVQRAPAQLGAQRTGVLLPAVIKHHRPNVGAAHLVGDVFPLKQGGQRGIVRLHAAKAGVQRHGLYRKGHAQIGPQPSQRHRQGHAVLAAGHPHQHPVAGRDHLIILYRLAHKARQTLHTLHHTTPVSCLL